MSKQSKAAQKAEAFQQEVKEVLAPLSTSADGQAPTIPFAPYENDGYTEPYSATLLEKANAHAAKIWTGRDGYNAFNIVYPINQTAEQRELSEKNRAHFDFALVTAKLRRLFHIGLNAINDPNGYSDGIKINELLKKLKRLEKKHDADDIVDETTREQIITSILMPTHMYGIFDLSSSYVTGFRYPQQKAVVNELLTTEDVMAMDTIIAYISRVRALLSSFRPVSGYPVRPDRLLQKWMPAENAYSSQEDDKQFITDLSNIAGFFNCALPYNVYSDLMPGFKHPTATYQSLEKLKKVSADLRNTAIGYITEQKPLSDLLAAIVELSDAVYSYFYSVAEETQACFGFINKLGISFEQLVKESKQRIESSGYPF